MNGGFLSAMFAMESLRKRDIKVWQLDLILILGLLLLNPVVYGMRYPLSLVPDSVAYLTMAETAIPKGLLYLTGWGHVDTATILPPLYPCLIAVFNTFHPDSINNALALSAAATLLSSVLVYFYVRSFASPPFAVAAVLLTQLSLYYVKFASTILTEALFLLLSVLTLCLAVRIAHDDQPKAWRALVVGLAAALACLARQIGLVTAVFLLAWLLVDAIRRPDRTLTQRLRLPALFFVGWASILGGYTALIYHQTGQSIFHQTFRMQKYTIRVSDTALFDRIAALENNDQANYVEIYRNRRTLRQLLPDGSEMLSYVLRSDRDDASVHLATEKVSGSLSTHFARTLRNLVENVRHFSENLGVLLTITTMAACIAPFIVRPAGVSWWPRLLLPGVLLTYVFGLSIVTGALARYVIVLYPLAFAQVAIELGITLRWSRERKWDVRVVAVAMLCGFALLLFFAPRSVLKMPPLPPRPDYSMSARPPLPTGAPTFALLPAYSYVAGGAFRILPNDMLARVVHYAQLTGVHWMLVPVQPERVVDVRFYGNAPWLRDPEALMKRTDVLRYCCTVSMRGVIEDHFLFELTPSKSGAATK
jgi:4-amino-4-deoxy-L-arabinose transferase-like glycosyltransferase